MNFKAILSNKTHPEYGLVTIPFPIPDSEYDHTIGLLEGMGIGSPTAQDCRVEELDGPYPILNRLVTQSVNVDELDHLAKRLDSFSKGEDEKFEAMASKLCLSDIKDFINLTFCCQQATVITDFSDLEQIGKSHIMTLNGGAMPMDQYQAVNGKEAALQLIDGGGGVITPYGVVYDNGMKLKQVYNGHQFPVYPYDGLFMVLEVTPKRGLAEGKNPEYLYLPAAEHQIERTLLRVGITELHDAQVRIDWEEVPEKAAEALDLEHLSGDDLPALNRMCRVIEPLTEADMEKLNAVVLMEGPRDIDEVYALVQNLDQFDFVPYVQTPEEYGRYMIQESGRFEFDENLDSFYNYKQYGEQQLQLEDGQFNKYGYVAYHGTMSLEELMTEDPTEKYQREQGHQMGGLC